MKMSKEEMKGINRVPLMFHGSMDSFKKVVQLLTLKVTSQILGPPSTRQHESAVAVRLFGFISHIQYKMKHRFSHQNIEENG